VYDRRTINPLLSQKPKNQPILKSITYVVSVGHGKSNGDGVIFQITRSGKFTLLHTFTGADGSGPSTLMQATDGNFYGVAAGGGTNGGGTLFKLSMGLGPFVETIPTFGKAGAEVTIVGGDLTGATSVTFNGAPAAFTIVSPTAIRAAVPSGATRGTVQVVTPGGTLSSNVQFLVL